MFMHKRRKLTLHWFHGWSTIADFISWWIKYKFLYLGVNADLGQKQHPIPGYDPIPARILYIVNEESQCSGIHIQNAVVGLLSALWVFQRNTGLINGHHRDDLVKICTARVVIGAAFSSVISMNHVFSNCLVTSPFYTFVDYKTISISQCDSDEPIWMFG